MEIRSNGILKALRALATLAVIAVGIKDNGLLSKEKQIQSKTATFNAAFDDDDDDDDNDDDDDDDDDE